MRPSVLSKEPVRDHELADLLVQFLDLLLAIGLPRVSVAEIVRRPRQKVSVNRKIPSPPHPARVHVGATRKLDDESRFVQCWYRARCAGVVKYLP